MGHQRPVKRRRGRPHKPGVRTVLVKLEVSDETERKFKAACAVSGVTQQKMLGKLVEGFINRFEGP